MFRDPNGSSGLADVRVLFNRALTAVNACYVHWNPLDRSLWLVNDCGTGSTLAEPRRPAIENSQCRVESVEPWNSNGGATLALRLGIAFKPAFAGAKNVYLYAQDRGGLNSNLRKEGVWVVPNRAAE